MDKATIQAYNKYNQVYDQVVIDFWDNFPKTTIDLFCKELKGKKVLDLGSGSGRDALILRDKGLEVICLDASSEMVKITRKLGFETVEMDFNSLELDENSFDGVWAYTSLIHIKKEETQRVLEKIYQSIRYGGVLLIGMIEGVFEGYVERENMPGEKRYFRYYEDNEIKKMVEKVGFKFEFQERYTPGSKPYLTQIYRKI